MFGDLSPEAIDQLLQRERIGRLGLTGDGKTYIYPIAYFYDGESVYMVSHAGLKVHLVQEHPQVCLEVDQIRNPVEWRSVMVHGRAEEVTDADARERAITAIAGEAEFPFPVSVARALDNGQDIAVFRIRLHERTGRYERREL